MILEGDLSSNLPIPWKLLTDRPPERSVSEIRINKEIWMIEEVEKFKPELQVQPFRYVSVFICGEVSFNEGRLPKLLRLLVAIRG